MIRPYREILALPGALAFSAAAFLARMPMSMLGIGIVLLVEAGTGSYGLAGAVAATQMLGTAAAGPRLARWFDRLGQARVLRPVVTVHVLGLLILVACAVWGAPVWTLFVGAATAGLAATSVGSLVRARWSGLLGGDARVSTAFALESALDEVIFVVGPILVTVLATRVHPAAGLLVAAAATLLGSFALAARRDTEPVANPRGSSAAGEPVYLPGLVVVTATLLAAGGIFGAVEVVTVAFTEERGMPVAAGGVLALFALGSMLAGLAYGAIRWRSRPGPRFLVAVALLTAGTVPMALAPTVPVLGLVMFLAGFAISPMIVAGFALVEVLVPPGRRTEGLTWAITGLNLGVAGSAAVAGIAIDAYGAQRAFLVAVACGVVAVTIAVTGARELVRDAPPGVSSAAGGPTTG